MTDKQRDITVIEAIHNGGYVSALERHRSRETTQKAFEVVTIFVKDKNGVSIEFLQ